MILGQSRTFSRPQDVPYHCFHHAVDVLFTVFRLLQISHAGKWTSEIEQYALLVASLCHDLGHFGNLGWLGCGYLTGQNKILGTGDIGTASHTCRRRIKIPHHNGGIPAANDVSSFFLPPQFWSMLFGQQQWLRQRSWGRPTSSWWRSSTWTGLKIYGGWLGCSLWTLANIFEGKALWTLFEFFWTILVHWVHRHFLLFKLADSRWRGASPRNWRFATMTNHRWRTWAMEGTS